MGNKDRLNMETWVPPEDDPPDPPDSKFCKKCLTWKPLTEFWKRGGKSKYYAGYCKNCHSKPYNYEAICCPHCKEKITFFGVDKGGQIVKQKSEILRKLRKEAGSKRLEKEEQKQAQAARAKKDLKDIF